MATATTNTLTVQEIADEIGLPHHVTRRAIDRFGLTEPRQRPRQQRVMARRKLPELRRRLREEGYPV